MSRPKVAQLSPPPPHPTIPLYDLKEVYQKFTLLDLAIRGLLETVSHSMLEEHEVEAVHLLAMEIDGEFRRLFPEKEVA